jgi:hypothetical protein
MDTKLQQSHFKKEKGMRLTNSETNRLFHRFNKTDLQLGNALALLSHVANGGELSSQQKNWVKEKLGSWMLSTFNVKKVSPRNNYVSEAFDLIKSEQEFTKEELDKAMENIFSDGSTIFGKSLED